MTCEEYYKSHLDPGTPDRCKISSIEASTAKSVALLGAGTTIFGVINLFWTGWCIKRFGIKFALLTSCLWPAVRLAIQNIGVSTGAGVGIIIVQCSQIITVIGGPAGYMLALNSYATEIIPPVERTATLGRLTGAAFFGTSIGYLAGGLLSDGIGIIAPFRVTLVLFCISTIYVFLFLPTLPHNLTPAQLKKTASISAFFEPIRMFIPRKWVLSNGRVQKEYGIMFLGLGAFFAVLSTGYIPVLLQMFATDVLDFGATENGYLISLNSLVRGIFLTFGFPPSIHYGRKWLSGRQRKARENQSPKLSEEPDIPTNPETFAPGSTEAETAQEPTEPTKLNPTDEESLQFDLIYTRWSILIDAMLTSLASFVRQDWQLYIVAIILPFASGTGSAAKGTILQMCSPDQRADALSAIGLVEMAARLATTGLFGYIFAVFATIGQPNLTFLANGGVALLSFAVLLLSRFPPPGARKMDTEEEGEEV